MKITPDFFLLDRISKPINIFLTFVFILSGISLFFWPAPFLGGLLVISGTGLSGIYLTHRFIQTKWSQLKAISLKEIDQMDGLVFERYVANLFKDRGYPVKFTERFDRGADLIVERGADRIAIQVKRYNYKKYQVKVEAVRAVVTSLKYYQANKAAVITNSYLTPPAKEMAKVNDCLVIERDMLIKWIKRYQKK